MVDTLRSTPARVSGDPGPVREVGASAARPHGRRPRRSWWPLWFALPAMVMVAAFFVLPQLYNLRFAFSNWHSFNPKVTFNGWGNFSYLQSQGELFRGLEVTILYALVGMVVQNVISLVLAYALRDNTRLNGFFRTIYFIPVLLSPVAAGYIWRGLLAPDGPLNHIIGLVVPGFDWAWLGETSTALVSVAFIDAWKWVGLTTLIYIAGMNLVSKEMIEAAMLDGANSWSRFRHIIFPLLAPAFTYNTVVNLVAAFSAYDVIQATTNGGPGDATRSINVFLRLEWGEGNFGAGSALSLTVTVLVIVVAIPLIWALRRREVVA